MSVLELFILAAALSMDAFAVSLCKGFSARNVSSRELIAAGAWFGGFQALMPLAGWTLGARFKSSIETVDHWIAFILLFLLGANMIRESLSAESEAADASFRFRPMLAMAVATSIDALAAGVTLGFLIPELKHMLAACALICSVTFCFSAAGVKIGSVFGSRLEKKAEFSGGLFLILLGAKILFEHLALF